MTKDELIEEAVALQVREVTEEKGPFHSWHEGWCFQDEEVGEADEATNLLKYLHKGMQEEVYRNANGEQLLRTIHSIRCAAKNVVKEAMDVMCVCDRELDSLKDYDGSLD